MNTQKKNIFKEQKIKKLIQTIIYNRGIETEDDWKNNANISDCLKKLITTNKLCVLNSIDLNVDLEEGFVFVSIKSLNDKKLIIDEIKKSINTLYKKNKRVIQIINIIFITDSVKNRVQIENVIDLDEKKRIQLQIKKENVLKRLKINYLYITDCDYDGKSIVISNINRYKILPIPDLDCSTNIEGKENREREVGYLLNVDLVELVKIYNMVGDTLFEKNVRYGINEQMGVDKAIRKTLETCPRKFWFRNNGVTIVVKSNEFRLDKTNEIVLRSSSSNKEGLGFFIVNGAQTVTTAAQYYYELVNQKEKEKELSEFTNAKVLLRIIHISDGNKQNNKELSEISVALNRQKPIKIEDIAYTADFIQELQMYLSDHEEELEEHYFTLVKRGEKNVSRNSMDLVDFARARMACAGKPAEARSSSSKSLLQQKMDDNSKYYFANNIIFPEADLEREGMENIFKKYYYAINFANKLAYHYDNFAKRIVKKYEEKDMRKVVINNGKWYFVAYVVQMLQGNTQDYSDFNMTYNNFEPRIENLLEMFASEVLNEAKEKSIEVSPNTFKKNILYNSLKEVCGFTKEKDSKHEL